MGKKIIYTYGTMNVYGQIRPVYLLDWGREKLPYYEYQALSDHTTNLGKDHADGKFTCEYIPNSDGHIMQEILITNVDLDFSKSLRYIEMMNADPDVIDKCIWNEVDN